MGDHLLEKARNRRVEALWANRLSTRLRAEMAEADIWAETAKRSNAGNPSSNRARISVFSAQA